MEIPDKYKKPDMAMVLRAQNAMCDYESETIGCEGIQCDECIMGADLPVFAEWLSIAIAEAQE